MAEKRAGGGKGGFQRAKPKILLELGEHPAAGGKIEVLEGKYGPYVSHNGTNATVPKGLEPDKLTVEDAMRLLDERIAKGGGKPKRGAKKAPAKKAETDAKPAAKKAPAKKAATKKAAPSKSKAAAE